MKSATNDGMTCLIDAMAPVNNALFNSIKVFFFLENKKDINFYKITEKMM